jgi:hypothetical protein
MKKYSLLVLFFGLQVVAPSAEALDCNSQCRSGDLKSEIRIDNPSGKKCRVTFKCYDSKAAAAYACSESVVGRLVDGVIVSRTTYDAHWLVVHDSCIDGGRYQEDTIARKEAADSLDQ